jgi:hypothetical protein
MNNFSSISTQDKILLRFNDGKCVICLDGYKLTDKLEATPCSHIFHNKCIKEWLNKQTYCPKCKSNCAIANLYKVTKLIHERLIITEIENSIHNAIKLNKFNELVAIIEELSYCKSSVYLKQEFQQIIEQQDHSKLNRILEKLLSEDSLSADKYEDVYNLFKEILEKTIEQPTNFETIILLFNYEIYLTTEKMTIIFNQYFWARNFDVLSEIIKNYNAVFSIDINIIKKVIQEDINKNNNIAVKQALGVLSILKQQEEYSNDISDIIIDLLEFIEKTDNNESIIEAIMQLNN